MATPSTTKITQFLSWRLLQCNLIKPWFVFSWHPHDYASKKLHHWHPLNYNIAKKQTSTLQRCQYLKLHFKETIFFTNLIPLPKEKKRKEKVKGKGKKGLAISTHDFHCIKNIWFHSIKPWLHGGLCGWSQVWHGNNNNNKRNSIIGLCGEWGWHGPTTWMNMYIHK